MSKPEARHILNEAKEGKPIPEARIRQALFVLGDLTWRRAPRPA